MGNPAYTGQQFLLIDFMVAVVTTDKITSMSYTVGPGNGKTLTESFADRDTVIISEHEVPIFGFTFAHFRPLTLLLERSPTMVTATPTPTFILRQRTSQALPGW